MNRLLGAGLALSLVGNLYLGFRLMKQDDRIEAGVHAEMMSTFALKDLCYFLRHSGVTKAKLLSLARTRSPQTGEGRAPPELTTNGFIWFPLEMTFTPAETIDQIKVAGDTY
jgi:hypothetical protein